MPYTRNTRIKRTKYKNKSFSDAQVEYRYPCTNITKWVSFSDSYPSILVWMYCDNDPVPWKAYLKIEHARELGASKDVDFAKKIIDTYHAMLDEAEEVPEIYYEKYPEEE